MEKYIYIFFGTIIAAMITCTVGYITLVVNKENYISNFRQEWINSLREEISTLISLVYSYHWLMKKVKFEPNYDAINELIEESRVNGLFQEDEDQKKYLHSLLESSLETSQKGFSELERVIFDFHNNYNKIKYRLNKNEIKMNLKLLKLLESLYKEFNLKNFDNNEIKYYFFIEESEYPNVDNCKICDDSAYKNYKIEIKFNNIPANKCSTTELINQYAHEIELEISKILKFEWNRVKNGELWFKRSKYTFLCAFVGSILILIFYIFVNLLIQT